MEQNRGPAGMGAESSSFWEIEECGTSYVLRMELGNNQLKDLELEFSTEELTVSAQLELKCAGGRGAGGTSAQVLNFEQRFVLPGVQDGTGIDAYYRGSELHVVVPKAQARSRRALCDSPSVYFRPALN